VCVCVCMRVCVCMCVCVCLCEWMCAYLCIRHAQTLDRVEQDGDDEHKGDHVFHPDLL
jgi:hypothetical protein